MIHKNFRIRIMIYVALISGLSMLMIFYFEKHPTFFIPVAITIALVSVVFLLIRYVEKTTKDLTHFLLSLKQSAFTESYPSGNRGKQYQELSNAMSDIIREFAKLNEEKELHYQYLQTLNETIHVAILSFNSDGTLRMMNAAAKQLLKLPSFSAIAHFKRIDETLYDTIAGMHPDERLVKNVLIGEDRYQLAIHEKEIVLNGNPIKIILLQNLNNELEAKEIEAWYQLIRVLTHEIMNSVTPITSLTAAMLSMLTNKDGSRKDLHTLSVEQQEDVYTSLSTIASRSKGLLKFVTAYKEYAKPPDYNPELIDMEVLLSRVLALLRPDFERTLITPQVQLPTSVVLLKIDASLMEQVLINLLKNAMEAVKQDGTGIIGVDAWLKGGTTVSIQVSDNGTGIDEDTLPKIFIPFYTTKEKGTGIGLSLSRQIVKLHGGNLHVKSVPGKGATFTIELPAK
jgi:two-component system, NtrC family, nitrogen regulation sensor histidine kinase NtrY